MIRKENFKEVLDCLGFTKENDIWTKNFKEFDCKLKADFKNEKLIYPKEIKVNDQTTSNFSSPENFVVFECINRLLTQGYNPKHIELEPRWQVGHGASGGKADILIKDNNNKSLLIIECKTAGSEFKKAWDITQIKPTQLFSYAQQDRDTKFIALYTSDYIDKKVKSEYYLISLSDDEKMLFEKKSLKSYSQANKVEDIYRVWSETYNKEFRTNGIFENNKAYFIGVEKTNIDDLKIVSSNDIKGKYNEFATIMRQHNIGGAERAFNVLVNLFLCKIIDENENKSELKFYWRGVAYDDAFSLQDRLQELYKTGMDEFLDEKITYISDKTIEDMFKIVDLDSLKRDVKQKFREQKFFTNNDFTFLDVHSEELFYKNFEVLLKVVKMFQDIRLSGVEDNQFLGDMFEGFLDQGVKQSEGQFFTPMPIVKFIINSLPLNKIKDKHNNPKAIDFACGAGHFLNEIAKTFKTNEVIGVEKEYRLSKIAKVSALMYGQENINIVYNDALAKNKKIKNSSFSVLVANPPYSVKGFLETLNRDDIEDYELTKTVDEKSYSANNAIECFFIERAKQILSDGGVTGIILPSSILNKGDGKNIYVATREILIKYFEIVAIVEFSSGTFGKTGTNTVTLFLKRRNDTENIVGKYQDFVDNLYLKNRDIKESFKNKHLLESYCNHIDIDFKVYYTLFKDKLNDNIFKHETFVEYKAEFEKLAETKNRKKRKSYIKELSEEEKEALERKELIKYIKLKEKDKLYYYCLAYSNSSDVVIVKSPSKNSENKKFLGYEWSGRKGNEGIQYIGGILNSISTPLYNPKDIDDNSKINKIIKDNFNGIKRKIPEHLKEFVSRARLLDMLDFSRVEFNKALSLSLNKKIEIKSKWKLVKIGEIAEVKKGKIITEKESKQGNIKVVSGGIDFAYYHNIPNRPKNIISISASGANSGYINFWREEIFASDCTTIFTNEFIINLYIYYLLKSNQDKIYDLARGTAQPHVYPKDIENFKIPFPPLNIQEKIVQECQKVDNEVLKAEKSIKKTKKLIEKEINSINGGEMVKLEKLMKITRGASPRPIKRFLTEDENGVNWIKIGDVSSESKYITKTKEKITSQGSFKSKIVKKGDFILSNSMSYGRPYILNIDGCVHDGWLILSDINTKLNKDYLYNILISKFVQSQFSKLATGTTVDNLNIPRVKSITIPLPPLQTQKEITTKIEKYELKIEEAKKVIDGAKELKEKILKGYLE